MSGTDDIAALPQSEPQPFLFAPEYMERIQKAEARGEYTAERCPERLMAAIIQLRGEGKGQIAISELLGCHKRTVDAIDDKYPEQIALVREREIRNIRRGRNKIVELINTNPEKIPPQSWAMSVKVLTDTAELMDGKATVRVEHVERIDIYGDWDEFVEKQLEPGVDVIEIAPEIGLSGEKSPPLHTAALPDPATAVPQAIPRTDEQSVVCQPIGSNCYDIRSDQQPDSIPGSGAEEETPGGGSPERAKPNCQTDTTDPKISGNGDPSV